MPDIQKEAEIKKAIDGLVDAALAVPTAETKVEPVATAPVETPAPVVTTSETIVKAKEKKDDEEDDGDADDKDPKKGKKKADKKDEKKPPFMKKSVEELASILSEDEVELIKAWREENGEIEVVEAEATAPSFNVEEITKSLRASFSAEFETLTKALTEKDTVIKSLSEKVDALSKQPAYDKRSLTALEPIEKSTEEAPIQKSQVLNRMLDLQSQGKGIRSQHVAEFETTGNISDPGVKALVMNSFKS